MKTQIRQGKIIVDVSQDELDQTEHIKNELKIELDEYLIYEREDIDISISSHLTKQGKLNQLSNLRHYIITELDYNPEYRDVVYTNKNGFVEFDNGSLFLLFANAYNLLDDIDQSRRVLRNILRAELVKWMFDNEYVDDRKIKFVLPKGSKQNNMELGIFPFKDLKYYNCFIEYINRKHIIDYFIDFSYLFQRIKYEDFIYPIKHAQFIDWLKAEDFINDKQYSKFKEENGFRSLDKSHSNNRAVNFNTVFEINK